MSSVAQALAENLPGRYSCRVIDGGGGRGWRGYWRFAPALLTVAFANYSLLHVHVASRGSTFRKGILCLIAQSRHRPYVLHLHGAGYFQFTDELNRAVLRLVRHMYVHAAAVIVLGRDWACLAEQRLQVSPENIRTVHNGVPANSTEGIPRMLRPYIVFLGVVDYRKGSDVLLESLSDLLTRPQFSTWEVKIAGPHPDPVIVEAAQRLGVSTGGRVRLLGPVGGIEKDELLSGASIFCLPSRAEALPMSILEAMAAGLPSVCTTVGSIVEVIRDGVDGVLVRPGDHTALSGALEFLMSDDARRRTLGAHARERWSRLFTVERMVSGVVATWDDALGAPDKPGSVQG